MRRFFGILILLLIGCVLNVLVAWAALNLSSWPWYRFTAVTLPGDPRLTKPEDVELFCHPEANPDLTWLNRWFDPTVVVEHPSVGVIFSDEMADFGLRQRCYGFISTCNDGSTECHVFAERVDGGFALYAFYGLAAFSVDEYVDLGSHDSAPTIDELTAGWLELWRPSPVNNPFSWCFLRTWFAMVYLPNWPGVIVNTIFCALVIWCTCILGPRSLRRRWRVHRGRCPSCAYPIGTSDRCSECGGSLKEKWRTDITRAT
jgi:hypothetical protein